MAEYAHTLVRRTAPLGTAVTAWPLATRAQQAEIPLVGFLQRSGPIRGDFAHFWEGLAALGYEAGRNIRIEQRYAGASDARLHELVQEITKLNPSVLVVECDSPISR